MRYVCRHRKVEPLSHELRQDFVVDGPVDGGVFVVGRNGRTEHTFPGTEHCRSLRGCSISRSRIGGAGRRRDVLSNSQLRYGAIAAAGVSDAEKAGRNFGFRFRSDSGIEIHGTVAGDCRRAGATCESKDFCGQRSALLRNSVGIQRSSHCVATSDGGPVSLSASR